MSYGETSQPFPVQTITVYNTHLFLDDLAIWNNDLISIVKYADNTTLLIKVCKNEIDLSQEVVNQFFRWNSACNPKKCNELILCEKVAHDMLMIFKPKYISYQIDIYSILD